MVSWSHSLPPLSWSAHLEPSKSSRDLGTPPGKDSQGCCEGAAGPGTPQHQDLSAAAEELSVASVGPGLGVVVPACNQSQHLGVQASLGYIARPSLKTNGKQQSWQLVTHAEGLLSWVWSAPKQGSELSCPTVL